MVDETRVNSMVVEYIETDPYTEEQTLIAACLSDILGDGLSMVYSFFDPAYDRRSLGTYMILDHIDMAQEMGLANVYLGYWVAGSRKMDYKISFRPFELCDGTRWHRFQDRNDVNTWQIRRFQILQDRLLG